MEGEVLPGSSRGYGGDVGLDSAKWSFLNVRACVSVACVRWGLQALVRGEERRDSGNKPWGRVTFGGRRTERSQGRRQKEYPKE